MKKLQVTIKAELSIPDDWRLVDHEDGIKVLDIANGSYVDFDLLPMVSVSTEEGAIWNSAPEDIDGEIMDMVRSIETSMKLQLN